MGVYQPPVSSPGQVTLTSSNKNNLNPADLTYAFTPDGITPGQGGSTTWSQADLENFYSSYQQNGPPPVKTQAEGDAIQRWYDYTTKYNQTINASKPEIEDLQNTQYQQQQNMLGALNSRGLGRSFLGNSGQHGYGSGSYDQMIKKQSEGMSGLEQNYSDLLNNMTIAYGNDASKDEDYWTKYASDQQALKTSEDNSNANIMDYLAAVMNTGKSAAQLSI